MKKTLLLLLMLPAMLFGAPVDPNLAQQVAENFINAPETDANGVVRKAPRKPKRMARAPKQITNDPQFYVFNSKDGDGFVIISADDVARPVLGYSRTRKFDTNNTPLCVVSWLSEYNTQILWAKNNNIPQTEEVSVEWQNLLKESASNATPIVEPLIQTIWNQAPYYNQYCPYNSLVGQRTVTGCVATAFAQVMRYWEWPLSGSGYNVYNCSYYGTQSAVFGNTTYKWQYMPDELDENSSAAQIDAVATLMYHCGVSVNMDYGIALQNSIFGIGDGSGAATAKVADAAKKYFKYSDATQMISKNDYSETAWKDALKRQLNNSTPMVYAGGGHAFVCDGYDTQDYFHFNWGWGGKCDGWFPVSSLVPGPNGIGSGEFGDYTSNQRAIINMTPKSVSSSEANLQLASNWVLSSDSIQYGGALVANVTVRNFGSKDFVGDIVAMVLDKNGNFFTDFTIQQNCTIAKNNSKTFTPTVAGNAGLLSGKYYVALFSRSNDLGYQIIGSEYYLNLTTFKVYCQAEIETLSDFDIYSDDNHSLVKGKQAQICVTLKNTGSIYFHGKAALVLYNSDLSQGEDFDEIDMSIAGISAGGTRTLTFSGTSHLDPGTYILALVYSDNNNNVHFAGSTYYSNPIYVVVKADGEEIVPSNPVTIKAKMPSDWGTTISAWTWQDGSEGHWTSLEKEGEWYSYTSTANPLNIIFVNGSTWNGDNNQTVDIRLTENSCLQIGNNTAGKRSYTVVDCPSEEFELKPGKYVIVANRDKDGDRNWYYMTSDLGTASTKRFQAVSTGTESIEAINITDLEDKYVWTLEKSGIEWKLKNGAKYVSWTSGNSATLATTARNLTLDAENNQVQVHFNDGTSERYLSLNAAANNNYFAFYGNQTQVTKLFFIPYKESEIPVTPTECKTVPYTETFASSQGDFTIENPELPSGFTSIWNWDSQYGMVAKSTKNNTKYKSEAWLLSPCIELPENDKCVLTFSHAAKFFSSTEQMTLYLTTGYIKDAPGESEWHQLTIPNYPTGTNWNWFESGEIDLSAYQGKEVVIAFRYVSDTNYAPQWEIKNFTVKQATTTAVSNTKAEESSATKILRNGQIFILRGNKTYTLQGQEVK